MTLGMGEAILMFGVPSIAAYYLLVTNIRPETGEISGHGTLDASLGTPSPITARYLTGRQRLDRIAAVAAVIDLCTRGQVTWADSDTPESATVATTAIFDPASLSAEEAALAHGLFGPSPQARRDVKFDLHRASIYLNRALRQRLSPPKLWPGLVYAHGGIAVSGAAVLLAGVQETSAIEALPAIYALFIVTLFVPFLIMRMRRPVDGTPPTLRSARAGHAFAAVLLSIVVAGAALAGASALLVLSVLGLGLLNGWCYLRLKKPSAAAQRLIEEINAIRQAMTATVENRPGGTHRVTAEDFERLLPYAMVFEMEDAWIRAWASHHPSILNRPQRKRILPVDMADIENPLFDDMEIGYQAWQPVWYSGPGLLSVRSSHLSVSIADWFVTGRAKPPEYLFKTLVIDAAMPRLDAERRELP